MDDDMRREPEESRVGTTCKTCGGDAGGILWEGHVLRGVLTTSDIVLLLHGVLDEDGVARLFRTGRLHGGKVGKYWVTGVSEFVADWERLGRSGRGRERGVVRTVRVVEAVAR